MKKVKKKTSKYEPPCVRDLEELGLRGFSLLAVDTCTAGSGGGGNSCTSGTGGTPNSCPAGSS